jgi:seryl-tRNA(Sec) selenium transferase
LLLRSPVETAALAARLQGAIEARCAEGFILEVEESTARAGGGSMPLAELPSHAVRVRMPALPVDAVPGGTARSAGAAGGPGGSAATELPGASSPRMSATALEAELRRAPVPLVARVSQDCLYLDVHALDESEVDLAADSVAWAAARITS